MLKTLKYRPRQDIFQFGPERVHWDQPIFPLLIIFKPIKIRLYMLNCHTASIRNILYFYFIMAMAISQATAQVGVGTEVPSGAMILLDGTGDMLHRNWTYWDGPRLAAELPIKWKIVNNPKGAGTAVDSNDPAAAGGKYGAADIVTKQKFRDFRLHVEFMVRDPNGNSGVYLQNRYEIQILDGDSTKHGMAAIINETPSPYYAYHGHGEWNAYDVTFRAARFSDGELSEKPMASVYFNGQKVHTNQVINKVWGGPNSGLDGGNDDGFGITDTPGGIKLQAEGHHVLYRNIWIKELELEEADTDF